MSPWTLPIYGVSLFRLRQTQVEEAVGAKMRQTDQTPAAPAGPEPDQRP